MFTLNILLLAIIGISDAALITLVPEIQADETEMAWNETCVEIFMPKACVENTAAALQIAIVEELVEQFRDQFLVSYLGCLIESRINADVEETDDEFFLFFQAATRDTDIRACMGGVVIDTAEYYACDDCDDCSFETAFEPIFDHYSLFRPQCAPQTNPWWHLEAIESEPDLFDYEGYHYSEWQNENVRVYVLDWAIDYTHYQFSHLLDAERLGGFDGYGFWDWVFDIKDHGSHIGATVMGKDFGVLRDRSIPLRGFGVCTGILCPWSAIRSGLRAVYLDLFSAKQVNPKQRAVILLSFGTLQAPRWVNRFFRRRFRRLNELGGIVVVPAGNRNDNACRYTPARLSNVISVGAYAEGDTRAWFSNKGSCVDAWAPGTNIRSAIWGGGYGHLDGTCPASAAIAGVVGGLLATNDELELDEIKQILQCPHHGRPISDSQSPMFNGYSASCGDLFYIAESETCEAPQNTLDYCVEVTGTIKANEIAYYRVAIADPMMGQNLFISLCESDYDTYLYLYDVNFNEITSNDDDAPNDPYGCGLQGGLIANLDKGDYWVGVAGHGDSFGSFKLKMCDVCQRCVCDCHYIADGDYRSCHGDNYYATCSNGYLTDYRYCPHGLVWNDDVKRCEWKSECEVNVPTHWYP